MLRESINEKRKLSKISIKPRTENLPGLISYRFDSNAKVIGVHQAQSREDGSEISTDGNE